MRRVDIAVAGSILVPDSVGIPAIARIVDAFSYPNPDYMTNVRFGNARDFEIAPRISIVEQLAGGVFPVPRGGVDILREILARFDMIPNWIDGRQSGKRIEIPTPFARTLRPYQANAVERISKLVQSMVVLPCAGGKTTIGAAAIERVGRTTLVLVHTKDLADQWIETIRETLGIEPGVIFDGKIDVRDVTVATVQTLRGLDIESITANFAFVILDEAHHAPADTFRTILARTPARWRVGLTATPEREDSIPVGWFFGSLAEHKTARDLIRDGYLMPPVIEFPASDFSFKYDGPKTKRIATLERELIANKRRNELIADLAVTNAHGGETVLVLSNRREHCATLAGLIESCGVPVVSLTGAAARGKRKKTLQSLRDGSLPVVVATSLADEGLDVERLSRLVLAFPECAEGRTVQRTGRLMRRFDGKAPKLYDVIDPNVETLARRAQQRRRAYRKLGLIE